jgi:hypothetical protein
MIVEDYLISPKYNKHIGFLLLKLGKQTLRLGEQLDKFSSILG